jgi:alkylation response protein AidB-like acyl-CoA dehydrogenase
MISIHQHCIFPYEEEIAQHYHILEGELSSLVTGSSRGIRESSMSKLFASQMCERVCSSAIDIYGYCGFIGDCPVERLYRGARVFQIYDGTNEVQKIIIAREIRDFQ